MRVRRPAMLKVYPGTAYGLATTHTDQLNADLLDFLRAGGPPRLMERPPFVAVNTTGYGKIYLNVAQIRYLRTNQDDPKAVIVWPDGKTLETDDPIEDLAGRINEELL